MEVIFIKDLKNQGKKIWDHMLQSAAFVTYIPDFSLLQ